MFAADLLEPHAALEAHADRWRELAVQRANAFSTPEWFESWLRHYGAGGPVRVAVVRDAGGGVRGIVPLVGECNGGMRLTRVAGANLADLVAPVCAADDEVEVARAALCALRVRIRRYRTRCSSTTSTAARSGGAGRARRRACVVAERARTVGPYAVLAGGDYDAYLHRRSASFRKRRRRIENRIARQTSMTIRRIDGDEVEAGIATLFELHDRRWEGRGVSSWRARLCAGFTPISRVRPALGVGYDCGCSKTPELPWRPSTDG